MADERFFKRAGPFTLHELANIAGAILGPGSDGDKTVNDVAPLSRASSTDISFLDNKKYTAEFSSARAGACIVRPDAQEHAPDHISLLITDQPYHGYAKIAAAFYPMEGHDGSVHPTAFVAEDADIGQGVSIGPHATIMSRVTIGDGSVIGPGTTVYEGVSIGENCQIFSNVTLQCCQIADRVILHPGVRIGQDGFGFAMGASGHLKVPQLGRVLVGDDVEIGANTTIDRGTGPDTIIGHGCKIDNLVQIGHNAQLGAGCVIVAQVGISGSSHLGNFVVAGGQVGIAGHLMISDGTQIAAQSGVTRNTDPGAKIGGTPAQPMNDWLRGVAAIQRLIKRKG